MLAGAYSYDPTVTAFLWLSFAGILEAALGGRKMDWKAYALIVLTFVWAAASRRYMRRSFCWD